jgi:hypothetical protein
LFSDCFKYQLVDDFVYKVECKKVKIGATKFDIGANKSAEGQEEEEAVEEEQERTEIDLVEAFRLQPLPLDKKGYVAQFKSYAKDLKEKIPDEEKYKNFQQKATPYIKNIVDKFDSKHYEFYMGESFGGMTTLVEHEPDGAIYAYFFADGLKGEKF